MAQPDLFLGLNDDAPVLTAQLVDPSGNPINLTGATITILIRPENRSADAVTGPCSIVGDPTKGNVEYDWGVGDAAAVGMFEIRFKIVQSNGKRISVPNDRLLLLSVTDDP